MNNKINNLIRIPVIINMVRTLVALILFTGFLFSARAQETMNLGYGDWVSRWSVRIDGGWTDNIYKLSSSQMNRMGLNKSGDSVSGRFNDMNDIEDIILTIRPKFKIKTKTGLFNRSLSILGIVNYQYYSKNHKKSNVNIGLSVNQKVSDNGTIILKTGYIPSFFVKNYLLDATDSTKRVSSSERIYHEAVYNELEFGLSYHHHIRNWIVDIKSDLFGGFRKRNYNDQFSGRDQEGLSAGLGLEIEPANWWLIYFVYSFEAVTSPVTSEILILDEPDYQIDFNNDRDFADNNIRTETTVDRSRNANNLEFGLILRPIERIGVHIGVELKYKDYTSQEALDPNYNGRNDKKTKLKFGFDYSFFDNLFLTVEYKNIKQKTNKLTDPSSSDEIADYEINIIKGGIQWKF